MPAARLTAMLDWAPLSVSSGLLAPAAFARTQKDAVRPSGPIAIGAPLASMRAPAGRPIDSPSRPCVPAWAPGVATFTPSSCSLAGVAIALRARTVTPSRTTTGVGAGASGLAEYSQIEGSAFDGASVGTRTHTTASSLAASKYSMRCGRMVLPSAATTLRSLPSRLAVVKSKLPVCSRSGTTNCAWADFTPAPASVVSSTQCDLFFQASVICACAGEASSDAVMPTRVHSAAAANRFSEVMASDRVVGMAASGCSEGRNRALAGVMAAVLICWSCGGERLLRRLHRNRGTR